MKRKIGVLLITFICLCITACGNQSDGVSNKKASEKEQSKNTKEMNVSEFEELLQDMPVSVISAKYFVQDTRYKSLYPDMLQAIIKNNISSDIKNVVIAFAAWDANNLPVKIKGARDFSDGAYIQFVNCNDINMAPGSTYGESQGYEVDENCGIKTCKAIVASFETFDGEDWKNPYIKTWRKLYENVQYSEKLTIGVQIQDVGFKVTKSDEKEKTNSDMTEEELISQINTQEMKVISTNYVVQDEQYKTLYPDMLQAIIQNNSSLDIKNAVIAFVAWDANNLPVKIKGATDFSDGSYIQQVNYNDINLVPGGTFGESSGFQIDETCNIKTFKAIVVSYEAFDGKTWSNPLYVQWCKFYEGIKLP